LPTRWDDTATMTAISSPGGLQSTIPFSTAHVVARAPATTPTGAASASTRVALGQPASATHSTLYTQTGAIADSLSALMSRNMRAGNPFQDVGAALLGRFRADGGNYAQSVSAPGVPAQTSSDSALSSRLSLQGDNTVSLRIATASGAKVEISLARGQDGMAVQIDVTDGTLTEDERNAIAALSGAFEDALEGLSQVPPRLDVAGLADVDPAILSSVNLRAVTRANGVAVQTIEFQADSGQRSITYTGAAGEVSVNADLSKPATFGTAEQQAAAIDKALLQFDGARRRGDGDEALMAMFKNAFSAVHSSYGAAQTERSQPAGTVVRVPASASHRALLSGLADYSASITQESKRVNPGRPEEIDGFSLRVSQSSKVAGRAGSNLAVTQEQRSALDASFHKPLSAHQPLALTSDKSSQSYLYYQVKDSVSTRTELAEERGGLTLASMTQSRNLSMQVSRFVGGERVEFTVIPTVDTVTHDLLPMLRAAQLDGQEEDSRQPRDQTETILRRRYHDLARSVAALQQG
jgi:hypothetical protein